MYNANAEGDSGSAASLSPVWPSSYAMVLKSADDGDALSRPCLGRTFSWTSLVPEADGVQVSLYREEQCRNNARSMALIPAPSLSGVQNATPVVSRVPACARACSDASPSTNARASVRRP